jgi:dihydrofolate reductase
VSVIVIEFITLDGIVSDPDGSAGTPAGGWAFRHGPETVAGDKFHLGSTMDDGVMLLGRKTWQLFSRLWPGRDSPFAARMNAVPKLVATRTLTDTSAWRHSQVTDADLTDLVKNEPRDLIITGSLSIVHELMARDLVDEYRLLTFPTILSTGERLFPAGGPPAYLECLSAEKTGAAVLTRYARVADDRPFHRALSGSPRRGSPQPFPCGPA